MKISNDFSNGRVKLKMADALFYVFLILMFWAKGLGWYDGQTLYRIFFWTAMLCAAGKIVLTGYTKKEWITVIFFGILAVLIERHSGEKGVLICYAVIAGMKGIPLKRIIQIGAYVYGVTLCGMVTYYGVFLEKSAYIEDIRAGIGDAVRYGLGYSHPNTLMVTCLTAITLIIMCLGESYNWKHAIGLMAGILYVFWYCMSYTGVVTSILMILLPLYLKKIRKEELGVIEYSIGAAALPLSLGYSFLSPYVMPESILLFLQEHLGTFYSRLCLAKEFVIPQNMSLLGTHVSKVSTGKYTLDNSFLYAFIFNGVLFFGIIIVLYFYMMYRLIKEKRNLELIIVCIFLVEAIMEPFMFNTSFKNITLFFLGELIWEKSGHTDGRFDGLKIAIPDIVGEQVCLLAECWNKNRKKILSISGVAGILVLVAYILKNGLFDFSQIVLNVTLRSYVAAAWFGFVVVGLSLYMIFCVKSIYAK